MSILKDILALSSGTVTILTGRRLYSEIDEIQQRFALFAISSGKEFSTWREAWELFKLTLAIN